LIQKRIYEENVQHGPNVTHKLYLQAMRAKRKEIYARLKIRTAPAYAPLLQLPVFLVAIEAIRKMCGTREGLLGLATKSMASGEESAPASDPSALSSIPIEPSLAAEGALWFPDLLVPDPQLILPFTLSAALFLNVRLSQAQLASEGIEPTKWSTRLSRAMQLVALAVGPMTLSVPSAMLVYWVSSSASAMLIHVALWKAMPHPPQQKALEYKPK
jgi:inner membrane protein COX18